MDPLHKRQEMYFWNWMNSATYTTSTVSYLPLKHFSLFNTLFQKFPSLYVILLPFTSPNITDVFQDIFHYLKFFIFYSFDYICALNKSHDLKMFKVINNHMHNTYTVNFYLISFLIIIIMM